MVFRLILGCLLLATGALGIGNALGPSDDLQGRSQGRIFYPISLANVGAFNPNFTILAALLAGLSSSLLSLFTLAGVGILAASKMDTKDDHGSYGHHYRRMQDISDMDWESISFMDWFSIARDMWTSLSPSSLECQMRFVCDLHQSKEELGPMADTLIHYFSYLQYGQVFRLPEMFRSTIRDLMDAAENGATSTPNCADLYSDCAFSVNDFVKKHAHSQASSMTKSSYDSDKRPVKHPAVISDNRNVENGHIRNDVNLYGHVSGYDSKDKNTGHINGQNSGNNIKNIAYIYPYNATNDYRDVRHGNAMTSSTNEKPQPPNRIRKRPNNNNFSFNRNHI